MTLPKNSLKCKVESAKSKKTIHYSLLTIDWRMLRQGFTIIELLIVIAIIAIMIGAATYSWNNAQMKGRDAKRKSHLAYVGTALQIYYDNFGEYPCKPLGGGGAVVYFVSSLSGCGLDSSYITEIPKDQLAAQEDACPNYSIQVESNAQNYQLYAKLENERDPAAQSYPPINSCDYNYRVENP